MDNIKDDSYFVTKIKEDLAFILKHMENVDSEELRQNEILQDSMLFRLIQISRMLQSFKGDLMQARIENDIVAVPESFQIEKTTYSPTEGSVTVIEWFKYPNFSEKKRYTYKVWQREGIWKIYDYTVVNLGTE